MKMVSGVNILSFLLILPFSLFVEGLRRKFMARMENRVGPPLIQPFYDIIKLLKKGRSNSKARDNIFFNLTPNIYFIATYALFLFIPFGLVHFEYDFILFIYITVLSGALYVISGFASNSPYGAIGSMRDLLLMVCYEVVFTVCLFSFVVFTGVTSLTEFTNTWMVFRLPLASLGLFVVALVETRITPCDTVEASPEVMGSVETEFSGEDLAFLELTNYLKFLFFIFLLSWFLVGYSNIIGFLITSFVVFFVFVFSQATTCRYRLDQLFKILMIVLLLVIIEFLRIKYWVR